MKLNVLALVVFIIRSIVEVKAQEPSFVPGQFHRCGHDFNKAIGINRGSGSGE